MSAASNKLSPQKAKSKTTARPNESNLEMTTMMKYHTQSEVHSKNTTTNRPIDSRNQYGTKLA